MPCLLPSWLFLCLLPACVCRQVVARSFLSGALRPFHVCPSPQTGNGHAHSASRNVDRCSKMVCSPGDFRCFLVRLSNVHCPPGNVFLPLINVSLCIYQCFLVHLSMSPCAFINAFLSTYQCLPVHLSMFFCPLINVSSSLCPPSFKFSLRFFYVNIFHLLTSFHDVLFFHLPYFITFPFLYEAWKPICPLPHSAIYSNKILSIFISLSFIFHSITPCLLSILQ